MDTITLKNTDEIQTVHLVADVDGNRVWYSIGPGMELEVPAGVNWKAKADKLQKVGAVAKAVKKVVEKVTEAPAEEPKEKPKKKSTRRKKK